MIKMSDLKIGDIVYAKYEDQQYEGVVTELNKEDKEVCVETNVQEFWFEPDHLYPIPLNEEQLMKLGFTRNENADGSVKYMKGSFRVLVPRKGDFSNIEIWWREDHRFLGPISVHELQNHYLQMTKVELVPA
jgi:hypothetical protein